MSSEVEDMLWWLDFKLRSCKEILEVEDIDRELRLVCEVELRTLNDVLSVFNSVFIDKYSPSFSKFRTCRSELSRGMNETHYCAT